MSKKILFMSSAKLTALSIGLLLAVFCTIGMSFRPVYDENEAEEIVMSGPRRSHWTTEESSGCSTTTTYHNKTDYARTVAKSMNVAYGTVEITAKSKGSDPVTAADGSQSYVDWDTGLGSSETTGERTDLEVIHTNTITFSATPTDPQEYRFAGWYSDAEGTTQVAGEDKSTWETDVKFPNQAGFTSYKEGSGVTTYEGSTRYTVTYYAKFAQIPSINVTFLAASTPARDNGYYTVAGKGVSETITTSNQTIGVKGITLTAYASEKAEFVRWYTEDGAGNRTTLSEENPCVTSFTAATKVGVEWRELKNNLNITFKAVEKDANGNRKGSYTVDGVTVSATDYVHFTGSTYKYRPTLVATPATGYGFKGWYVKEAGAKKYLSTETTWNATITDEVTIYADFVYVDYPAESLAQFKVGSTYYTDLNAANTAAKSASKKVIVCTRDGYLLPGNYTISSGVSLLIPYSTAETVQTEPAVIDIPSPAPLPNAYRTLTMLDGADITCEGTICVGGQIVSHQGGNATAYPAGDLGVINMANGGHIELKSGATLYAWGFIKGQDKDQGNNTVGVGTITANSGSTVWEDIPFGDFRGGSQLAAGNDCADTYRWFPFQSYTIQNIEVPLTIKYGASEKVFAVLYIPTMSLGTQKTKPTLIANSGALFLLKDSKSGVRKWYDPTTDLVCYELSGTAQLDQLNVSVNVGITVTVESSDFDLPICGNMHIILTNCNMTLSKPMTMHAGSVIEIKPDATVTIASNLHVFDLDQFDMFANSKYYLPFNNLTSHKYRGTGTTKEYIDDARLIVDGTLIVTGGIYTTANGANIMGNGGGKVIFSSALPSEKNIWFLKGGSNGTQTGGTHYHYDGIFGKGAADIYFTPYAVNAANLCNEDGTYTKSSKNTFYNVHGRWFVEGKQNERTSAGLEHTYEFTYMASGNSGENVPTSAVYSHDRTGLEPRMKWFNVNTDACANWWVDGSSRLYNWTLFSDWHQFIPTEVTDMYGCSDGSLYNKISCNEWEELGGTDENCLYTIGGVKKALVGTTFIEMEPNSDDAAYHRKGADTEYYISFDGCIWHPATKIEDEKKAYTVEEQQFIWFEGGWLNVEREAPFFYSTDELNVKTYYEYVGSEWIIAEPYVRVSTDDPTQTRALLSLNEAVAVANSYKNPTITILRDIPTGSESAVYTAANTTCTLDLNGHTVTSVCQYMLNINATGSTFIIKDKTSDKKGELRACPEGGNARTIGYQVTKGTLKLESGKMYSTNMTTRTGSTAATFTSATNTGVVVKANAVFTVTGGIVESVDEHQPYAVKVETNGTMNLSGTGVIKAHATKWYSTRGVSLENGKLNISGGSIQSTAIGASTVYGVVIGASASWNAAKSTSSSSYGILTMTGGEILARTPKDARGVQVNGAADVTGDYNESPIDQTVKIREYGRANISGGSIIAEATTSTTSYGVLSYGTTEISGGTITSTVQKSDQNTAHGVRVLGGTTTIKGNAYITANAPKIAYGLSCSGAVDGTRGWQHFGELKVNGGTIIANTTSSTTAYGLYVSGTTSNLARTDSYKVFNGDYAAAGTAVITGGNFYANAKTTDAGGIKVDKTVVKNEASATPVCTINGGYYKASGTGSLYGCYSTVPEEDKTNFQIKGGYYSHDGGLATYAVSPKQVVTLLQTDPNRPDYEYKVAEAYTVTFKNGETQLQSGYQEVGKSPVYEGDAPTKASTTTASYVFDGWSTTDGGALVSPLPALTSAGATYYAHFAETTLKYMATFDAKTNGGNEDAQVIYVEPAAGVGTLPTATKTGYTFNGWYTAASGGTKITSATVPTGDVTYFAQFSVNSYTLTWNLDGGTVSTAGKYGSTSWPAKNATGAPSVAVPYGSALTAPAVTKTGYTFVNWGGAIVATMPAEALTYTATWRANTNTKYTVKHCQQNIADDGYTEVTEDRQSLTGTTGASVTPAVKSYDGFLKPAAQTTTIAANGSTVVEYRYDRVEYSIKWNAYANGGTCATPSSTVRHGATLGSMPTATKTGLRFDGWYTQAVGGVQITETTPIMQNYGMLYAQFVEITSYTVTFNANGHGTAPNDQEIEDGEKVTEPAAPAAAEWIFGGWYKESTCTNAWDFATDVVTGTTTLFAKWTAAVASVTAGGETTYYATLATAITAANGKTNPTVKMLKDVTFSAAGPNITTTMTLDLNGKTIKSTRTVHGSFVLKINKAGITVTITDSGTGGKIDHTATIAANTDGNSYAYGIHVANGTLNVAGGTICAKNTSTTVDDKYRAYGIYCPAAGSVTMSDGRVEAWRPETSQAFGIYAQGDLTMTGGTVYANADTKARGIYVYGASTSTAIATLANVTVEVETSGDNCLAIYGYAYADITVNSGTYTANGVGSTVYAVYARNTATVSGTINGGKFSAPAKELFKGTNAAFTLSGGYYVHDTDLEANCATNFHVLPLTGEDPYMYEVAEAYTLTWDLDGGTVTTAGTGAAVDATGAPNTIVKAGASITAPVVTKTGYTFDGWSPAVATTMPAANTTYTATWAVSIDDRELDIVDWTNNSVTINATNLKTAGGKNDWKVYVNGTDYDRTACGTARTLTVSGLSLTPNGNLLIQLKDGTGIVESQHNYKVPQIYTANATLSGTTSSSVVYVYGGKLTISGNTTLAALYVCPGAEVEVNGSLTVGKLVLRTKPWATAAISGNVTATNVYYTRIAPDGSVAYPTGQYYQFGLPYECDINDVRLSDGTTPAYNTTWILKSYNEQRRAESGTESNNWDVLASSGTIAAGRGYEMFSSYKYYREYYFPVTPTDNTSVAVTRYGDDKNNSGWNIVCSPLMSIYTVDPAPEGWAISWLQPDGSYDQEPANIIHPAIPFSYQAKASGSITFGNTVTVPSSVAARRVPTTEEKERIQWIHLDVKDAAGEGDQTSIYSHPTRYEQTYKTGIDVAKQSLTASRAILYSSHAYGEMAFAGVADSLLEAGVALTVYSPSAQELTISMRDNDWLNRMEYVWLIDVETGMQINLLNSDYTFDAAEGTTRGRFFIRGQFKAPNITTDIQNGAGIEEGARKVLIDQKIYIEVNGRLYDATGKIVSK